MKALALTALLAFAPLASNAAIIDFTGLPDGTIDQSHGDIAGVLDVVYDYSYDGGTTYTQGGLIWASGYFGGLSNTNALIAPADGASIMRITLNALGGTSFSSFGAAVAYWTGIDAYDLSLTLRPDGETPVVLDNTTIPSLTGATSYGTGWTTATLLLGPDWNVGYQSVTYQLDGTVPLPAGGVLLVSALAGIAALRRRKAA